MPEPIHIFLSYAREDRAWAEMLAKSLEHLGWFVWWDPVIPLGKHFADVIEQNLKTSQCVIVIWSRHSVTSRWVQTEAAEGLERQVLFPIFIDDARAPLEFRRIQGANLQDWQGRQEHFGFAQLVKALSDLLGPPRFSGISTADHPPGKDLDIIEAGQPSVLTAELIDPPQETVITQVSQNEDSVQRDREPDSPEGLSLREETQTSEDASHVKQTVLDPRKSALLLTLLIPTVLAVALISWLFFKASKPTVVLKSDGAAQDQAKIPEEPLSEGKDRSATESDNKKAGQSLLADGSEPVDEIFQKAQCTACHVIPGIPKATGTIGPKLVLGTNAPMRLKDPYYKGSARGTKEYIEESIVRPSAYVVKGFPDHAQPKIYGEKLSPEAIRKMVDYLAQVKEGKPPPPIK